MKLFWLVELHSEDLATRAHAAVAVTDSGCDRAVRVLHDGTAPSASFAEPGAVRVDIPTRTDGDPGWGLLPVAMTLPPTTTPDEAVDFLAAQVGSL